jgi:hypothetical protein
LFLGPILTLILLNKGALRGVGSNHLSKKEDNGAII